MGLTVFDLFGQILTVTDMQNYLRRNSVNVTDFGSTGALAIRCFLLLLDSKADSLDQNHDSEVLAIDFPIEDVIVKEEILEETMPIENTDTDFYMALPAPSEKNSKKTSDKVIAKRRYANICRGQGCCCNRMFPTRREKQQHYIDMGCYRCKVCGEAHVSKDALKAHTKAQHRESVEGQTVGKKFECEPCGRSFVTAELFDEHKKDLSCKGLQCPLCGFGAEIDLDERYKRVAAHMKTCIPGKLRVKYNFLRYFESQTLKVTP